MKVLYFGPITPKGKPSIGGYEAANRKNIEALVKRGIEVVEFPNPVINKRFGKLGKLAYLKLFLLPLGLWKYRKQTDVILHTTPLYGNLLLPSLFTLKIAKCLGIHVLVDMRAGSLIYYYKTKGTGWQKQMQSLLEQADMITVEGSSYIQQIKSIIGIDKPTYYFPNIADCTGLSVIDKPKDKINIFYFGRLTKTKGIDLIVEVIKKLDDRFKLYVAGAFGTDCYREMLDNERIEYLGFLNPMELKEVMKNMHFFIFPTRHVGEGQSNSLIEAMSAGLVPIVSDQGFNAEVVANCGSVLPQGSTADEYVQAILKWVDCDMLKAACDCQRHIVEYHNVDVEIPKLITLYKKMLCR